MKRIAKCCALALVLVFVCACLGGCHGKREQAAFVLPDAFDEDQQFDLVFWAKNDTNKTQTAIYEKGIEDFHALYPNINVTLKLYTDYGVIYNDVITNISTNTTPNVCITYPDHIATYLTGEHCVVPLNELFTDEKYGLGGSELRFDSPTQAEIIPKFLEECVINGAHYAVPYMRSTEACYVNVDLLEKLGYTLPEVLTWDFVWEVSEAATAKDAEGNYLVNGQKTMIPFIYKSTDNMMIQMLRQQDAGYSGENGEILIFNEATRDSLLEVASHAKTGAFSTFKISGYPANFLNAGQCIFAIDSTAGATWMGSHAPLSDISADKFVEFRTEVRMIPQFDPENPRMISQGPSICVFNKEDPQEVLASWLFAQYLLTNEVQIAYSQTEGYVPVTEKAQQSEEYQSYLESEGADDDLHYDVKLKATKLLLNNTGNTFVTPVFNGSTSLREAAGYMIEDVTKAVRRKKVVDDGYINELFESVVALKHLDVGPETVAEEGEEDGSEALPAASQALLITLGGVWVLILLYLLLSWVKKRKMR